MECLKANSEEVQTPKGLFFCALAFLFSTVGVGLYLGYYNGNYKGVEIKVFCLGQTIKRLDLIMIFQGHIPHQGYT